MKVLMFGWEFPPQISGGLGTACLGLTRALHSADVEILFVLPKLHEEQRQSHMEFLNASHIPLPGIEYRSARSNTINAGSVLMSTEADERTLTVVDQGEILEMTQANIHYIEVPSSLKPYDRPSTTTAGIVHHNQAVARSYKKFHYTSGHPLVAASFDTMVDDNTSGEPATSTYSFSGNYGPDLLAETFRYADVAETIARNYEFDVIHVHDWMTFPAGVSAKRVSGKPLVVHVHSSEYDRSGIQVHPELHAIEQRGMLEADRIVAVSDWTRQILISRFGIDGDKIDVVHNGVEERRDRVTKISPVFGTSVVTFLGRITYQKGPMYFVEAAFKVLDKFPQAHFVVAGSGDLINRVIMEVARRRYSSNFHFTGFLNKTDIDKLWAISNVYVMPSVSEPFGITPLEAIQAGVPVIISTQSGVSEVVPDAIKVDFWDTDALANAICNVLQYKSLADTMAQNSQEEIRKINWAEAGQKIKNIYYELSN